VGKYSRAVGQNWSLCCVELVAVMIVIIGMDIRVRVRVGDGGRFCAV